MTEIQTLSCGSAARGGRKAFASGLAQTIFTLLPYAYLGILLAAAAHEVLGHGLAAVCVGGQFLSFQLDVAGMGWAQTVLEPGSPAWKQITVLFGGVAATITLGLVLLVIGAKVRKPLVSLLVLAMSLNLLLEGAPYVFWNAVHPVPPGDIGYILGALALPWLRPLLAMFGGVVMFGAIGGLTVLMFRRLAALLWPDGQPGTAQRILVLALLGLLPALGWFTFDWDALAPGLGCWPNLVGAATHVVCAGSLFRVHVRPSPIVTSRRAFVVTALVGYGVLAGVLAVIMLWLAPA